MPNQAAALAKLSAPGAAGALRRERLWRRIDDAGAAVWIAAPPGAGKTTLAADFAARGRGVCLWYRIDSGDADPAAFFYFMGLAADQALPGRSMALPLLAPEYLIDLAGFARRFFRVLFAQLPVGSLLVLDNFHELDGVPILHEILREALSEIPPGIKMIVVSRSAPPPALARLVANQELALLGWEDLRLTADETRILAGAAVDAAAAARLHAQSGGWVAGVILLLRHSPGGDGEALPLAAQQSVFDYFAGEILATAPAEARDFLIRTAFLPDFTVDLARRVGAGADAGKLLDSLCRQHCFVDRSGQREFSYRYHDLFREFLRAQAGADTAARRGAAAAALAEVGRVAEAIPLLLENGDWPAAAPLILGQAQMLVVQGRWQTLARWIDALPAAMREAVPWLSFWRGVAELPMSPSAARALIERAYATFAAAGDVTGQLLAAAAVIEANFHEWADFSLLDTWISVLEGLGGVDAVFPSREIEARVLTGMLMAIGHRRPGDASAQRLVDRLEALLATDIDPNQQGITAAFLLWHCYWIGDFVQVRRIHGAAGRLLDAGTMTPLNDILLRCLKGQGEIFLGDNAGAQKIFDEAEALAQRYGLAFARGSYVLPIQIYRQLSFGEHAAADETLAEVARMPISGAMNASQDQHSRALLALQRGNTRLAGEHIRIARELAEQSGSFVARSWNEACWALICVAAGEFVEAQQHIDAARAIVIGRTTGLLPYHLKLIEAWLVQRRGDAAASHPLLRDAFAHAAAHGLANTLQWLPTMMSELCAEALAQGIEVAYVRGLIAKRGLVAPSPDIEAWPWPLKIRSLGGFEVLKGGEPLEFPRKLPKKSIALLKALVAFGGREVPESRLLDALWPEGDAGDGALAMGLHRLRKLLGDDGAIIVQGGRVSLDSKRCWVDAWAFERLVEGFGADGGAPVATRDRLAAILDLYRGPFLADDVDAAWAIAARERLRAKFIYGVTTLLKACCRDKACDELIAACQRGLEADELAESFYQELMRCYHCLGRDGEGLAVYRRMKRTFSAALGVAPSAASEAIHRQLQGEGG